MRIEGNFSPWKTNFSIGYTANEWNEWMCGDKHTFTKGEHVRKPEICEWILQAWEELDPQIIIRSFLKCSLTNKLDGTEDDALWQNDKLSSSEVGDDDHHHMDIFYNDENNIFDAEIFYISDDEDEFFGFTSEEMNFKAIFFIFHLIQF